MAEQATLTLLIALTLLTVGAPLAVTSSSHDVEDTGALGGAGALIADVQGPIDGVIAPTSAAPAFLEVGDTLRVELEVEPYHEVTQVELVPSFDDGEGAALTVDVIQGTSWEASTLWEGPYSRQVIVLTGTLPDPMPLGDDGRELYDIVVDGVGEARRAVSVYDAFPSEPHIVMVADTQTGDPRALSDGFHEGTGVDPLAPHESDPRTDPDLAPFHDATDKTLGINASDGKAAPEERWHAYREAIDQINALQPDLVLFSGDLNFGQLAPASYHVEYEEAWALLNGGTGVDGTEYEGFHVPTLLSPGNHDAYVANGEDGIEFWKAFFGPPAYATTFADITFVSINTYDWSELDRTGVAYAVSAWGGQVRAEQLAWLHATLCEANGGTVLETDATDPAVTVTCIGAGDERIVTFSHHSPSWEQDEWEEEYQGACEDDRCQGVPVAEQFSRGFITFTTTGQGWTGENRLELRDLLREQNVDLHAAGHTHRDRVARDVADHPDILLDDGTTTHDLDPGDIVEVPQKHRDGLEITELHLVTRDNQVFAVDQTDATSILTDPSLGPLYLETTTTASDTQQWFGYRPMVWHQSPADFDAEPGALGIAPFEMGYDPGTQDCLDALAGEGSRWNLDHARFGLFSTPSFEPAVCQGS